MTRGQKAGFSLVELSIVLVILGLLVGGIMTGQSLIRAAELRAVITEYDQFVTAKHNFQDRYYELPGDMSNAVQFWGRADDGSFSGQCANPDSDEGSGAQTCNGNGNGRVHGGGDLYERFRIWQHLANAGLLTGSYKGVTGPEGASHHIPGVNSPASKLSGTGWSTRHQTGGVSAGFDGDYGGWLLLGGTSATANPNIAILTPEEMWNIDTKSDDGKPGTGHVRTRPWAVCTLASGSDDLDADYNVSVQSKECLPLFPNVF